MRVIVRAIMMLCVAGGAGCSASLDPPQTWLAEQGGLVNGAQEARVQQVSQSLISRCGVRGVTVRVLRSDGACAYAWPDGGVFVTRGLVDLLDDAELVAAIAHELGHLLNDGHLDTLAALKGSSAACGDAEHRADLTGIALLKATGLPPEAMARALTKVLASPALQHSCKPQLRERIHRLHAIGHRS